MPNEHTVRIPDRISSANAPCNSRELGFADTKCRAHLLGLGVSDAFGQRGHKDHVEEQRDQRHNACNTREKG